jgi:tetratricopeptide (TPR) repeat protein
MNGHLAMDLGHTDRAVDFDRRASDRDPLSPGALGGLAAALWSRGQLAEAEAVYRLAAALSPARHRTWIALVVLERGDQAAARAEIEQETEPALKLMGLGIVENALGNREASDRALTELITKYPDNTYEIAQVYAHRGDADAAFQWLDRAFSRHQSEMLWFGISATLRPIRADPRYDALLRKMGLPALSPPHDSTRQSPLQVRAQSG